MRFLEGAGAVLISVSAVVGAMSTINEVEDARSNGTCLTSRHLTAVVANTVSSCLAGTLTGAVLGPWVAVRALGGALIKPVLFGVVIHQGVIRFNRYRAGVQALIKKLESGDVGRQLEALRAIIAAAVRNCKFAKEFNKLSGIELLLQRLSEALPDCPLLHLLAQALAELIKDADCRESLVAAGGVPRLVALLKHSNPVVAQHALTALGRLADHPLAQDAIREAGGLSRLVEMLSTASSTTAAATLGSRLAEGSVLSSVGLLQALALDPANKAAIGAAGGVASLLEVIKTAEAKSEVQSEAVVALHNLLRGNPDNQRALAVIPAATEVLREGLAGYGPCWHPVKADLHALLNVLARLQGAQEASGFVVVQGAQTAA